HAAPGPRPRPAAEPSGRKTPEARGTASLGNIDAAIGSHYNATRTTIRGWLLLVHRCPFPTIPIRLSRGFPLWNALGLGAQYRAQPRSQPTPASYLPHAPEAREKYPNLYCAFHHFCLMSPSDGSKIVVTDLSASVIIQMRVPSLAVPFS